MIKQITAAILMATASFAASAAEPAFYIGADVGGTKVDGYSNENSFGAFAGYKFNENIAVEAGYRKLGDFNVYGIKGDITQTSISVLAGAPVANNVSVYGRLGYNRLEADASGYKAHDNKGLYGIGVSYAFTKEINARIEWQRPSSDSQNLSVGVAYSF